MCVYPAAFSSTRLRAFGLRLVQPVDQMPFMVGLPEINLRPGFARLVIEHRGNIVERVMAVNLRLAGAQQVQIGAVQYKNKVGQNWSFLSKIIGQPDTRYRIGIFRAR